MSHLSFSQRNKFIGHRTTASGHLTTRETHPTGHPTPHIPQGFTYFPWPDDINPLVSDAYIGTVALALLYILAMFGWGSLFLSFFPARLRFWDELASRIVAGCGVLYACFIGLSAGGWLFRIPVGVVLGIGAVASCFFLPAYFKNATSFNAPQRWNVTDRILAVSIGVLVALQLAFALTPLIFYDLQVYHLLAPAQFLKSGGLAHIPWNVLTNSPLSLQLTVGMSLALDNSGQLAKLLFAVLGCMLAPGIYELLRPLGRRAALLAALFVMCYPEFWVVQTLGAVDISIAALMVFGTLWAMQAMKNLQWRPAVLASIAFGLALGSRYQAIILTALTLSAVAAEHQVYIGIKLPDRRTILKLALIGSLVVLLVSPWLIRNHAHTGNPVYPLMYGQLGGSEWSGDQASRLSVETLGPQHPAISSVGTLLGPIKALSSFRSNGLFGIALICVVPFALASPKRELKLASILGLTGLIIWGLIRPTGGDALIRYNAVSIAFLLAAAGAILGSEKISEKLGTTAAVIIAGVSLVIGIGQLQRILPAAQSLIDPHLREALYEANVPSWAALDYMNENLDPAHDKVLVIGETRGFWLQIPNIVPSAFNGPQLDEVFGGYSTPDSWQQSLQRLGITHVLFSFPEFQRLHEKYGYLHLPPDQMVEFNHWLQGLPRVFEDRRGTIVLALKKGSDL